MSGGGSWRSRPAPRAKNSTVKRKMEGRWEKSKRVIGGTNARGNLLTACHSCNSRRRQTPIYDFVGAETLLRLIRDYPRVAPTILQEMRDNSRELPTSKVRRIA